MITVVLNKYNIYIEHSIIGGFMKKNYIRVFAFTPFVLWFSLGYGLSGVTLNTIIFGLVFLTLSTLTAYPFKHSKIMTAVILIGISYAMYREGLSSNLFGISNYFKFIVGFNLYYLVLIFMSKNDLNSEQTLNVYKRIVIKTIVILILNYALDVFENYLEFNMKNYVNYDIHIFYLVILAKVIVLAIIVRYKTRSFQSNGIS